MRFTVLAALLPSAAAVRSFTALDADEVVAQEELTFSGDATMICKTPEIWHEITQGSSSTFTQAMNINWERVEALKDASIEESKAKAKACQDAVETLSSTLKGKLGNALPLTGEEHVTRLLESGLGDASFKGSDMARDFKCGKIRRVVKSGAKVRLQRRAYKNSLGAFKDGATAFFSEKKFRLDGDLFHKVCHKTLVGKDDREETYCHNLCQEFRDIAQSLSHEMVGASAGDADKLKDEILKKEKCVAEQTSNAEQCDNDWSSLVPFRDHLAELKTTYGDRSKTLRTAETALADALDAFDELHASVSSTEQSLEEASKALTAANQGTTDAKASLDAAAEQEKTLKGKMDVTGQDLGKLSADLRDAQTADSEMGRLKDLVVNVMLMMERFTEAALREPIRNIGFPEYPNTFGFQKVETLASEGVLGDTVKSMHGFCESTAMPAFEDTKQLAGVDLTPLCSLNAPDTIMEGLRYTVQTRTEHIKDDLNSVVSWLSPYRAQKLLTQAERAQGEEAEDKLISDGQLANLEKVKSVYFGDSHFYKYLLGWRKNGPHHQLIAKLESLISSLQAKVGEVEKKLAALRQEMDAAEQTHQQAVKKLQQAVATQSAASSKKGHLEAALSELQDKGQAMKGDISELEARVAKAQKDVKAAVVALTDAYSQGTGSALMELEAEEAQSRERMLEIERALASNNALYQEVSRRL